MWKYIKRSVGWAFAATGAVLAFVPDYFFDIHIVTLPLVDKLCGIFIAVTQEGSDEVVPAVSLNSSINIFTNRILLFLLFWVACTLVRFLYSNCKRSCTIKGNNYKIVVKYGDIFKEKECQKIIDFDECFTTEIGTAPWQIKKDSICGQYLTSNPITQDEMAILLQNAEITPQRKKSDYKGKDAYKPGTLLQRGDFFLMSFACLNSTGRAMFKTQEEYLDCLNLMWREIDRYYQDKDVCIPILGSGRTKIKDRELTQQELLDIIIESYKLSPNKLNGKNHLVIVCRKRDGFSLGKIGDTL